MNNEAPQIKSSGKNSGVANLKPFKKGDKRINRKGKAKGQRDYATIYREALIKLGKETGISPQQIENDIIANGARLAKKGDYRFYKDMLDRLHGTPTQTLNLSGGIEIENSIDEKQLAKIAGRILNGNTKK